MSARKLGKLNSKRPRRKQAKKGQPALGSRAAFEDVDHCDKPDRHDPKLVCGHPTPCPWHTVKVDSNTDPWEIRIPVTARYLLDEPKILRRLFEIAEEFYREKGEGAT